MGLEVLGGVGEKKGRILSDSASPVAGARFNDDTNRSNLHSTSEFEDSEDEIVCDCEVGERIVE
jgi:hypothetical protein